MGDLEKIYDEKTAFELGIVDFIKIPFFKEELITKIYNHLFYIEEKKS